MAALPQWNIDPSPEAVDPKPWRVIWPYHPILNTWSKGSGTTHNCGKFKSTKELEEATLAELPPGLDQYGQAALIFPLYRLIAYHTVQPIRYKFAQWIELQLSQRDPAPYFQDLKLPDHGPVPLVPTDVVARIAQADHHTMQVMQGHQSAYNAYELNKYCKKYEIPFPLTSSSTPTTEATGPPPANAANYPPISKAQPATKARSKPPPIALTAPASLPKKPTNQAASMTAQRPVPPPKLVATSTSTAADHHMEPAPEEPADVHMAPVDSDELTFTEMLQANDAAMAPAPEVHPDLMDISTSPRRYADMPHLTLQSAIPPPLTCGLPSTLPHALTLMSLWSPLHLSSHTSSSSLPKSFVPSHTLVIFLKLSRTLVGQAAKPQLCPRVSISSGGFSLFLHTGH